MNITVDRDETIRTIALRVQTSETMVRIYEGYTGRGKIMVFQPDRIRIEVHPRAVIVDVSGPNVLKSGAISESRRGNRYWYEWDKFKDTAPAWLLKVVRGAIGEEPR